MQIQVCKPVLLPSRYPPKCLDRSSQPCGLELSRELQKVPASFTGGYELVCTVETKLHDLEALGLSCSLVVA